MTTAERIQALLAKHAGADSIAPGDRLFGGGINLSSVGYTEFMLAFEDEFGVEIDLDGLDPTIETVGQFVAMLEAQLD